MDVERYTNKELIAFLLSDMQMLYFLVGVSIGILTVTLILNLVFFKRLLKDHAHIYKAIKGKED